jgi:hypothetical protein
MYDLFHLRPTTSRQRGGQLPTTVTMSTATIDRLDSLNKQDRERVHRAGAVVAVLVGARRADVAPVAFQVWCDQVAVNLMHGIHQLRQMQLNATRFAQGSARRPTFRAFDATATDFSANLVQVLLKFDLGNHGPLLLKVVRVAEDC